MKIELKDIGCILVIPLLRSLYKFKIEGMKWKSHSITVLILCSFFSIQAQWVNKVNEFTNERSRDNIKVIPLDDSNDASSFVIWVKNHVRDHYHKEHTEVVYVLEGFGIMTLGDKSQPIEKGDYIFIPRGISHSVRVTNNQTLKVIGKNFIV